MTKLIVVFAFVGYFCVGFSISFWLPLRLTSTDLRSHIESFLLVMPWFLIVRCATALLIGRFSRYSNRANLLLIGELGVAAAAGNLVIILIGGGLHKIEQSTALEIYILEYAFAWLGFFLVYFRSSFLSFRFLEGLKFEYPRAALLALLAILALEVSSRCLPWNFREAKDSLAYWIVNIKNTPSRFDWMKEHVLSNGETPRIAFLGSSQTASAISPAIVEKAMGLQKGSVVNLGLVGAHGTFEALYTYRKFRDILGQCDLIVFIVGDFMLNSGLAKGDGEFFEHKATISERILFSDSPRSFIYGILTLGIRGKNLFMNIRSCAKANRRIHPMELKLTRDRQIYPRAWRNVHLKITSDKLRAKIHRWFEDFQLSYARVRHLERLFELIKEDGGDLIVVRMPSRSRFESLTLELYKEQHDRTIEEFRKFAERSGSCFYMLRYPSECGLTDDDYYDSVHLRSPNGTRKFSLFLSRLLLQKGFAIKASKQNVSH
jgi:hypothetical protein